jgi:ABC-2 type transport system ATP-binding protein
VIASPAPVAVESLTKRFGSFTAVDGLTLTLSRGTVTGFLGPNGAGKSTTIRMLVGLTSASSGSVEIFGRSPHEEAARAKIGYLPADAAFVARLSGVDNLDVLADLRGTAGAIDRTVVSDALSMTADELRQPVRELSSGMRQKLDLVAALQHRPDLVILDEPANRLDPLVHRAFCTLIRQLADAGRTVLLSSHVLGEVEAVCDQIALIKSGRLIQVANVDDIRTQAQRRVTIRYASPHEPSPLLHDVVVDGNRVTGRMSGARPDLVRELLSDPTVEDIEIEPPSLEDVFLDLYAEGGADADPDHR